MHSHTRPPPFLGQLRHCFSPIFLIYGARRLVFHILLNLLDIVNAGIGSRLMFFVSPAKHRRCGVSCSDSSPLNLNLTLSLTSLSSYQMVIVLVFWTSILNPNFLLYCHVHVCQFIGYSCYVCYLLPSQYHQQNADGIFSAHNTAMFQTKLLNSRLLFDMF